MSDLAPTRRWRLPERATLDPDLAAAAAAQGISARTAQLLAVRGQVTAADLASYLGPPQAGLHDPALLPDAGRLLARVRGARSEGEGVLVFGDFDADGLTGLAILTLALRRLGLDVLPYVPDRLGEGHGLSLAAVETARAAGRRLIITVDTGSSSVREVAAARAAGIDVIVTDHHRVPSEVPLATALVNPHRPDSGYPDARLAGSGVAFKVAQLLLQDEPGGPEAALALADLATVGTVADVAPIVGENRALARLGLAHLRSAARPGLAALLAAARLTPARVDLEAVAFAIAPRLNAGGRVGDARTAAELLLAPDVATAEGLAGALEEANRTRRDLTAGSLAEARVALAAAPSDAAVDIVAGPWPVGIVGLVAGRLAEESGRPAVVVSTLQEPWRASARGGDGALDLAAAFASCGALLLRHGGHPQAAGCELHPERYEDFRRHLLGLALASSGGQRLRELRVDLALEAQEVDYGLHRELQALEPCGPGNPVPQLGVAGLEVARVRPAAEAHASLTLRKGREVLDAIAFERADLLTRLAVGDRIDVVARLASRQFGGYETLQLELLDLAPAGHLAALAAGGDVVMAGQPAAGGVS